MSAHACKILLLTLLSLLAIGASSAYGACPKTPPPCNPAAFTGSVRAMPPLCEKRTRGCQGKRGPAGPRGIAGKRGATGAVGIQGAAGANGTNGSNGATGPVGASGAMGIQGIAGSTGATGAVGATGVMGQIGLTGLEGSTGATGATGLMGLIGLTGLDGATGATGLVGLMGLTGATGPTGAPGDDGLDGDDGAAGATGATGPAGADGQDAGGGTFAYIYNLGAQVVPIGSAVVFDSNGPIGPGIIHAPGDSAVTFVESGVYEIDFSLSGTEPNQMSILLNGVPVDGSTYASGAGTQQNSGQLILNVGAGDVITLNNYMSSAAVGLATPIGGTSNSVNASLIVKKLD